MSNFALSDGNDGKTLGTTTATSTTLTLDSASTFAQYQGIVVYKAGPTCSFSEPRNVAAAKTGAGTSKTYAYKVVAIDNAMGSSQASSAATVTNGTLDRTNYNTVSWDPPLTGSTVGTLSGGINATVTSIAVAASAKPMLGCGIVKVDSEIIAYTGVTGSSSPWTLTGCTRGAQGTTAASHSNGATVLVQPTYAVYCSIDSGAYTLVGFATGTPWVDYGRGTVPQTAPSFFPSTPPAAATPGLLCTQISSITGTTVTMADAASTTNDSSHKVDVIHDDTAAFQDLIDHGIANFPSPPGGCSANVVALPSGIFRVRNLVLNGGVKIQGQGIFGTQLSASPSAGQAFITLGASTVSNAGLVGIGIGGDHPSANPGQHGLLFDAMATQGGLWYSEFRDLMIQGFGGVGIWMRGDSTNTNYPNQFNRFENVYVMRPGANDAAMALVLTGECDQNTFLNCEFDGLVGGTSKLGTNVYLGLESGLTGLGGPQVPADNNFITCTSQFADTAVSINCARSTSLFNCWFEYLKTGVKVDGNSSPEPTGTVINACYFTNAAMGDGTTGSGGGAILRANQNASVTFTGNFLNGTVDNVVLPAIGTSTAAQIVSFGNVGNVGNSVLYKQMIQGTAVTDVPFSQFTDGTNKLNFYLKTVATKDYAGIQAGNGLLLDGTGTGSNYQLVLGSDGRVGIGDISTSYKLKVKMGASVDTPIAHFTDGTKSVYIYPDTIAGLNYAGIQSGSGLVLDGTGATSSKQVVLDPSGKVGIGKSSPSEALDIVGNIAATGNVSATSVAANNTAKAWVSFGYSGGTLTTRSAYNATVSRTGAGDYTVSFTIAMSDQNFATIATSDQVCTAVTQPTGASSVTVKTYTISGGSVSPADAQFVSVSIYR